MMLVHCPDLNNTSPTRFSKFAYFIWKVKHNGAAPIVFTRPGADFLITSRYSLDLHQNKKQLLIKNYSNRQIGLGDISRNSLLSPVRDTYDLCEGKV